MTSDSLVYIETGAAVPQHTFIWLHGLGANGYDLQPFAESLAGSGCGGIRQVFPHAPYRHLDLYGDAPIRAWYRFDERGFGRGENENDIHGSIEQIEELLLRERQALPKPGKLILGGFSQGGVIALAAGLTGRIRVDGIVALSAYYWEDDIPASRHPPVFMGHGDTDAVIPLAIGYRSAKKLKHHGIAIDWHEYPMAHSICNAEIDDLSLWLKIRLTNL